MKFQALRGFRDYLPPDASARAHLFSKIRHVALTHGFEEIETPALESLDLFKLKSGEGIVDQTFSFKDKGDRDVTLIPENTPSLARIFSERSKSTPLPVKWISIPKLWRYEEPQAGRLREFSQVSLDIYGVQNVAAEVELLSTTRAIMDSAGLSGAYVFKVSDRRLTAGVASALGVKGTDMFYRALDRYRKIPEEDFLSDLEKAGLDEGARTKLLDAIKVSLNRGNPQEALAVFSQMPGIGEEGKKGLQNLEALFSQSTAAGLSDILSFDFTVVRGLAYYTSTVFEAFDSAEKMRSLFGGGRYDRLIELFGGGSVPACGLAIGDQTLELLLREKGVWPTEAEGLGAFVAAAAETLRGDAVSLTENLRRQGISADHDIMGRNLSGQLREAARRKSRFLLIVAPEEKTLGKFVVRNMRTGQQEVLSEADALRVLRDGVLLGDVEPRQREP